MRTQQSEDIAKREMDLYEMALCSVDAKDLLALLEDLTIALSERRGELGDYDRQMRVKRVILRWKAAYDALNNQPEVTR